MPALAYANAVVIDTSAVVALIDESDALHEEASICLERIRGSNLLCAVDVTSHESFTRLRYDRSLTSAVTGYQLLRAGDVRTLHFMPQDEKKALHLVSKYDDQVLSFHDALCAAVMIRLGLFRIFSFDRHFWTFGFEVVPGMTRTR